MPDAEFSHTEGHMSEIKIDHIKKNFGKVEVIKEFDEKFADGEFVSLLGRFG